MRAFTLTLGSNAIASSPVSNDNLSRRPGRTPLAVPVLAAFSCEFTSRFLVQEAREMSLPQTNSFDAQLPGVSQSVRIASFHDAKVFVCRWTIRDKDPSLKALLRHMEQARSSATADSAIWQLKQMLTSRGMLVTPRP